jgi:PKD repeat protein
MTMDKPEIALANWQTQHYLTVRTDPANITANTQEGWYAASTNVSLTAEPLPDYALGYWDIDGVIQAERVNPITVNMNTTHTATAHYIKTPPQAAFTYSPTDCYVNSTITLDASAATAGGSNDTLAKFEWDFGDGSPKVTETSFTTNHVFTQVNNCTVTLNVTNGRGVWSTTSQELVILPPVGPEADFICYPASPRANQTVIFDAATSILGWNGTDHPPIVDCTWDFGDGNVTSGSNFTIFHQYILYGDYMAKLNITDANGLKSSVTRIVRVRITALAGDINGDGAVDIFDAIALSKAYSSRPGSLNWNPNADINSDNVIDIYDAITLASNYGKAV